MNDLQNFRETVAHRRPGRILYYFSCTADLARRIKERIGTDDFVGHFGMLDRVFLDMQRPAGTPAPDYAAYWKDEDLPQGTTINAMGVAMVPSGLYHFWGYVSPLRHAATLAEIENYPLDDMRDWDCSHMRAIVEQGHGAGKMVTGFIGHIYENAWQIRGLEEFLTDLMDRPAWAQCMLDRIAAQNMTRAIAYAKAGADMLYCGDDIASQHAMMFAPETWRKMLLSRWREIWAAARRIRPDIHIWYHSDGNIISVVGDLIDAGVDVLNPVQPECMDIDALHKQYGHRLTLDGCMGTQSTMPFGTTADVRQRVRELIDKYGRSGGLIISPTHVLEPEVPIANIEAFAEACREFGTFG